MTVRTLAPVAGLLLACGSSQPAAVANGTTSAWQTVTPMLTPRANHCAATTRGYLFVLGGNHQDASTGSFVNIGTVDAAQLMPDGTLGAWKQAGTLPGPMSQCTATADDSHLYIVDALFDDDMNLGSKLWQADVAADGTVGTWTSIAPLPGTTRALLQQAWVTGTHLIAMDSRADMDATGTEALEIDLTNPTAGWSQHMWTTDFRGWPQYAFSGSFAYILGGYTDGDNMVVTDGLGAAMTAVSAPGPSFAVTALPHPTTAGDAAAIDGYVFLFGGKSDVFGGSGSTQVYSAPIEKDGTLGMWTAQVQLPEGRAHLRATVAGDFVYVTGGGLSGGGLDTVFAARARF